MTDRVTKKRGLSDFMLGFLAGGALVGIPVGLIFGWSWVVMLSVILGAGLAGGLYGDRFLHAVVDSKWWSAIVGYWRHG